MNKKSCVIYDSWGILIKELPDDMAGGLIKMVLEYAFDGSTNPSPSASINAMFAMIKDKMDDDIVAYEEVINKRSEAAKKRWNNNPPMQNDANACTCIKENANAQNCMQMDAVSVSDSVSDNVSPSEIKKENAHARKFVKPTLEDVKSYCRERNNGVNPEAFIDFYESKGWKVGNQPMKDWKASVRNWERRDNSSGPPAAGNRKGPRDKIHGFPERKYDFSALENEAYGRSP